MKAYRLISVFLLVLCFSFQAEAREDAIPAEMLSQMPIKEVTVFKDGHAFLLHSGALPVNEEGHIVIDYLPRPVLGTFWPYSDDKKATLKEVTASKDKTLLKRKSLNLRELLKANAGAKIIVTESFDDVAPYEAEIVEVPQNVMKENETDQSSDNTDESKVVLLKTANGVKVVDIENIKDITFKEKYNPMIEDKEIKKTLTLKLNWGKNKPQKKASVGMTYLERGIRWIPSYKVIIDEKGKALIRLQASLINELADLEDVTMHLVIGVPTFAFKDAVDPISLEKTVAQLSQYFRPDTQTAHAFSNAIMTQTASFDGYRRSSRQESEGEPLYLGPEVEGADKNEDLFVFTVKNITLKKGQRTTFFIDDFTLDYKDVYALDIPFTPPPDVWQNFNSSRQSEMTRLLNAPKVMHMIRMKNESPYPLTTAPALILKNDRIIAQGMMKYTPISSETDLEITAAVDIKLKKKEKETQRIPNAVKWSGYNYGKIELSGDIKLTNYKKEPVKVEVVRHVLGNIDMATNEGEIEAVNMFEDGSYAAASNRPFWWGWYSWPYWWFHFNSIGKVSWVVDLEPGKEVDLSYKWHYFWR